MKNSILFKFQFLIVVFLVFFFNSCAPVFSDLQSARTVGKDNLEVTGGFSTVSFHEEGEGGHVQSHIGLQGAYGISDRFDLRIRYDYLWLDDNEAQVSVLGVGPKFSILKDRIAGYLPVGFAFGEDINKDANTWQIHPTLLFTIPVVDYLDVNPSAKLLIPFDGDDETTFAINLGLGVNVSDRLTIRPEYGVLFDIGSDGHFGQFSIGVTVKTGDKSKSD